jgi:hypothetical protein
MKKRRNAMIKSFECYTRLESALIGPRRLAATLWRKRYDDGRVRSLWVADSKVTRAIVREAFEAMEAGYRVRVFTRSDADGMWLTVGRRGD